MSQSLAPECTKVKEEYDSCFNAWFERYLEPAVKVAPDKRAEYSKAMAAEYEIRCGILWRDYRKCLQKALEEKGLDKMLVESVKDNPLDKPPTESETANK